MRNKIAVAVVALMLSTLCITSIFALGESTGSVTGEVTDGKNPISGATITIGPPWRIESFEEGFRGYVSDSDVPLDPNNPGHEVYWHIERSTEMAYDGIYSLEYTIDGTQDDGTIWLERTIPVEPNTDTRVHVDFRIYSHHEFHINVWPVVAYAGVADPEWEEDFTVVGRTNYGVGWLLYELDTTVSTGSSSEIWVAFGLSVTWETWRTHYFDYVQVSTSPSADSYTTYTDEEGLYNLDRIPEGTYDITASAPGYYSSTEDDITIRAGKTTKVNFELMKLVDMFVENIRFFETNGRIDKLHIEITVLDNNVNYVEYATVSGRLTLPDGSTKHYSGETKDDGQVTFHHYKWIPPPDESDLDPGWYLFTVEDIHHEWEVYNPSKNVETTEEYCV